MTIHHAKTHNTFFHISTRLATYDVYKLQTDEHYLILDK